MTLRFVRAEHEVGEAYSFFFEAAKPLQWTAGQYINLTMPGVAPVHGDRLFTIASAPYEKQVMITTLVTDSPYKQRLNSLLAGETVIGDQVGGDFTWQETDRPLVFIAGGIGITPFRSMLKQRHHEHQTLNARLIYKSRGEHFVYQRELDKLAAMHKELEVHYVSHKKLTAAAVQKLALQLPKSLVYISGPEPMVDSLGQQLKGVGLPSEQLKQDWYPGYTEQTY